MTTFCTRRGRSVLFRASGRQNEQPPSRPPETPRETPLTESTWPSCSASSQQGPVPVRDMAIVGHSSGGLGISGTGRSPLTLQRIHLTGAGPEATIEMFSVKLSPVDTH